MQLSARGAQKKREESKKLNMFSKQWLPGDTLRVFYPIYWENGKPEIAVGAIYGHSVSDIKGLGLKTAFIPSTTEFDENALPIGPADITYQFSKIAKVFVNGAKRVEEQAVMNKNWPNESARKEALKAIEEKYDAKNNMKAVKPIIGRVQYYISTEVLSVKLVNDAPNDETIAVTSAPLSNQTIDRLYTIMADPKYAPEEGAEFLEVEWKYPVDPDKSASARKAAPAGVTSDYRMVNQHPDSYKKLESMFPTVVRDSETITRRATRTVDPAKVRAALTQYAFLKSEFLDAADEEDAETLCSHCDLIKELDIVRAITNAELVGKIQSAIKDMEIQHPTSPESIPTPEEPTRVDAPLNPVQAQEVAQSQPAEPAPMSNTELPLTAGAPSLSSLLNNVNNISANASAMEDIDFTTEV